MTQEEILAQFGPREAMEYDVVVIGGGPGGLATAIRIKQLAAENGNDVSVVVLEKGSEPGAHILSGAVMDPKAMDELIPNWKELGCPINQEVTGDDVLFLSETGTQRTPDWLLPRNFHNDGCYVVSLSNVVKWMAAHAESIGVEIFPGFTAAEVLYNDDGSVKGVATGNLGIGKDGEPTDNFQLGMELHAKYTIFAEGARGHLGKQVIAKYNLAEGRDPQSYAIGIKELWEVDPSKAKPGLGGAHLWVGPCKTTPLAAAFCTTSKTTKSPSALCSASTTKTHGSAPLKKCNAGKHTQPLLPILKAPSALATAHAPSTTARHKLCPRLCSQAAR